MVKVMHLDCEAFKFMGITRATEKSNIVQKISTAVCLVAPVLLILSLLVNFVSNFGEIVKSSCAFCMMCIFAMNYMVHAEYLINRVLLFSIIDCIQRRVDSSFNDFRPVYEKRLTLAYCITYNFYKFAVGWHMTVMIILLLIIISVWIIGGNPEDVQYLTSTLDSPFDTETWSGVFAVSIFTSFVVYTSLTSTCLYVRTGFDEIRFKLRTTNQCLMNGFERVALNDRGVQHRLQWILKDHLNLLLLLSEINLFLDRIKYYIFTFGALSLCTALFQVQQNVSEQTGSFVVTFSACSYAIINMFIFCLCGEVIIDAHDISNDVYELVWYRFDSKSKMMVQMMISRTQLPYHFASYESLDCSLGTFVNIVRKDGAAFTMLKSI